MPRTASDARGALPGWAAPQLADAKFKNSHGACSPFMLTRPLIAHLRKHFALDWQGIHGAPHWARVRANGLRLAEITGAHQAVVELFAFLHDSCRLDEYEDPGHGGRAAAWPATSATGSSHCPMRNFPGSSPPARGTATD